MATVTIVTAGLTLACLTIGLWSALTTMWPYGVLGDFSHSAIDW